MYSLLSMSLAFFIISFCFNLTSHLFRSSSGMLNLGCENHLIKQSDSHFSNDFLFWLLHTWQGMYIVHNMYVCCKRQGENEGKKYASPLFDMLRGKMGDQIGKRFSHFEIYRHDVKWKRISFMDSWLQKSGVVFWGDCTPISRMRYIKLQSFPVYLKTINRFIVKLKSIRCLLYCRVKCDTCSLEISNRDINTQGI